MALAKTPAPTKPAPTPAEKSSPNYFDSALVRKLEETTENRNPADKPTQTVAPKFNAYRLAGAVIVSFNVPGALRLLDLLKDEGEPVPSRQNNIAPKFNAHRLAGAIVVSFNVPGALRLLDLLNEFDPADLDHFDTALIRKLGETTEQRTYTNTAAEAA